MADKTMRAAPAAERMRSAERHEARQLFLISYPLCLMAVIARRALTQPANDMNEPRQSVFAEARSSAYAAVGYAFHA